MYVLLGANGNITSRAARGLLERGQPIRVVGRRAAALAPLQQQGAEVAIGDASNPDFLAQAFAGASAVYTMIPTDITAPDVHRSQSQVGSAIAEAVTRSSVRRVVNLSSVGAELAAGTGPIVALHEQEQRLNAIAGLDLLHLRPGYFMENHLQAVHTVAALGVYASLERGDVAVPMTATADIAAVVVRELIAPGARGVLHLHAQQPYTFAQAAAILGAAIGRADLAYVQVEPAQVVPGMIAAGFSADAARLMAQMAQWLSDRTDAKQPDPVELTPTTLAEFGPRFREAFENAAAAA